jgi:hypothetical protein
MHKAMVNIEVLVVLRKSFKEQNAPKKLSKVVSSPEKALSDLKVSPRQSPRGGSPPDSPEPTSMSETKLAEVRASEALDAAAAANAIMALEAQIALLQLDRDAAVKAAAEKRSMLLAELACLDQ